MSSQKLYYDGRNNLNAIHVNCGLLNQQPNTCVKNSQCGWCGGSNTCVAGSIVGPLAPCLKDTFQYTQSNPNWNPLRGGALNIRVWDENFRNNQNIVAPAPDLTNLNVYSPYQ